MKDALANLTIFRGLEKQEREQLLSIAHEHEVSVGDYIITQGKMKRNLWFMLSGRCQVTRRTESGCQLKLAELGPTVQFGEMSFFHAAPHSADVIALSDMELLRLDRDELTFNLRVSKTDPRALGCRRTRECVC